MSEYSQQKIQKIYINNLKNLKEVEIDFRGSPLTALIGINGSGKSTILHALACCYKPVDDTKTINYKFSQFFTPTVDSHWKGSQLTLYHDYRIGVDKHEGESTIYSKNLDRWSPKYDRRIPRNVYYIGIDSAVPKIEQEKKQSFIKYSTKLLSDDISKIIKEKASFIMNRDYSSYHLHSATKGDYIGVEFNKTKYSSLSMSAGEQRIFTILSEVFNAPKYSLILIDEIDLLLHVYALKRLISVIHTRAEEKNLQIIFSTHSLDILNMNKEVNIRHLYNTPEKTMCLIDTKPDTIFRITGEMEKPIQIFVEDTLAVAIISSITEKLNLSRYTEITRFGAARNSFTTAAGLLLSNRLKKDFLFVLDGDEYKSKESKVESIKKSLTGTTSENQDMRNLLLDCFLQFNLPEDNQPEFFIHSLLKELPASNQVIQIAHDIHKEDNSHKYIDEIIDRLGYSNKEVGLTRVIDAVQANERWEFYISPIKQWLVNNGEKYKETL
ncbi:ATP-dependent nuclease [Exiguobacterium artemiae]|uniref:ATP-dependent nuclease n=1 Tax=Exiguobacterium artemiae TaxID=340145 RepID=UPI002964231E|nr:AAA family ATPase [Exiguobacterium sibiricum]MDW2885210.1 AAA family ATPase [Exiguobacterium sibiricum]